MTGEAEGDCRVEPCSKVPAACRDFFQKSVTITQLQHDRSVHSHYKWNVAVESAKEKDPVDFWNIASEMIEAVTVSKLAQLLLTCAMPDPDPIAVYV